MLRFPGLSCGMSIRRKAVNAHLIIQWLDNKEEIFNTSDTALAVQMKFSADCRYTAQPPMAAVLSSFLASGSMSMPFAMQPWTAERP